MNANTRTKLVRIGGGVIGAALMALAVPAGSDWGSIGSIAPKPADAAASCNATRGYEKGVGNLARSTSVPVNRGSTNCLLGNRNQGPAVRTLQSSLNRCYRSGLKVDGIYGPKTKAAVENAQRRSGVAVDGVYGQKTARAIKWPFSSESGKVTCETLSGAKPVG